jgi:hypoxanthine phosphoribosyltransferase
VYVDFVHVSSPKGESVRIIKDISMDITGRDVLIVEEIIDAGRTLSFLKTRLFSSDPASVKIVTLLDKPARRELPIKPDYVGRTIDDRFVIGYGLDSEERGRNYRDIFNYAM